jgi:peptidoglycan/xylan/chitin deacetylase (PgdA/CDA1 family)
MSLGTASLSLDLDNKWAYLRAAGRKDWMDRPGYLPLAVDRIVDMLGELQLPLTVFLVGRDLVEPDDCEAICSFDRLTRWEPANHSLNHLPWMHTMDPLEVADEIELTGQRIADVVGRRPLGFRGPGFSCPEEVLRVLVANEYLYDASVFPTSIAPIARAVFMLKAGLNGPQRQQAKKLYGGFSSLRQPNRPFVRRVDRAAIWEIPVTVMPLTRTPIHLSYFLYLASFSKLAAKSYLLTALRLCRATGTPPSLLLHPPDFLGCEDDADMAYFPGMKMARRDKLALTRWALMRLRESFDVRCIIDQLRMSDLAARGESFQPTGALAATGQIPIEPALIGDATIAKTAACDD